MKRTILMLLTTLLVSSCAGFAPSTTCTGQGSRPVTIHYGDSQIKVDPPIAQVHRRGDFVLNLKPVGPGANSYKGVNVTVVGKTATDKAWIHSQTESHNSAPNHRIVYCVPAGQALVEYKYKVTVDTVGFLDPRVKVSP